MHGRSSRPSGAEAQQGEVGSWLRGKSSYRGPQCAGLARLARWLQSQLVAQLPSES